MPCRLGMMRVRALRPPTSKGHRCVHCMEDHTEYRAITFRLYPGSRAKHDLLTRIAGACRWVWNAMLEENRRAYEEHIVTGCPAPSTSFQSLGVEFTKLRNETPWLQKLPYAPVRYVLKYQSEAWARKFRGGGFPKFRARRGDDSFTVPQGVKVAGEYLHVPKVGLCQLSRHGGNPYADCPPVKAVVKRVLDRWYCVVFYRVPIERADNGLAVGVDMNCGQVATSTGHFLHQPNTRKLEARRKRYQRQMARRKKGSKRRELARHRMAKTQRKITAVRHDWHHRTSRTLADTAGLVVIEDLKPSAMGRSAKGTVENPGKNVRQKAGLNQEMRNTGWGALRRMIEYKAAQVEAVPPMYTSQTCRRCGNMDAANRRSQADFKCTACGHTGNADVNAALNILASGTGASGRRGAWALAPPMNRQHICQRRAA